MKWPRCVAATAGSAALSALLLGSSCSSGTEPEPVGAALEVLPASVRIEAGDTLTLAVTVYDQDGIALSRVGVSFRSDSLPVATVTSTGLVRGIGPGTANVTVTAGALVRVVPVTILGPVYALRVTPALVRLVVGDSVALNAEAVDVVGNVLTGVAISFAEGDAAVAGVSTAGVVHATGAGTTTATAFTGRVSTVVPVRVFLVQLSPSPLVVMKDSTGQLTVTVRDSTGALASNPPIAFASADASVATVSPAGLVRGIRYGPTSVTATYAGLGASVRVAVVGPQPLGIVDQTVPLANRPYGVAVSSTGKVYVTQLDGASVSAGQLPTLAFPSAVAVGSTPTDVAFNPAGTLAYVTNQFSANVGVIDVASGVQTDSISVAAYGTPFRVVVSSDGATVYVSTNSGRVLAIDAASRTVKTVFVVSGAINGLALHPTSPLLYATSFTGGALFEINTSTGAIRGLSTGGSPQDVAVSLDGATLFVADQSGPMQVRNAGTGALIRTVAGVPGAITLKLSPDGSRLWASLFNSGALVVADATTFATTTIVSGGDYRRIGFDAAGARIVVADQNGYVLVIR